MLSSRDLVLGIAATHGVSEGGEIVQGHVAIEITWDGGDIAFLVLLFYRGIQGNGEGTGAIVETDDVLECGRVDGREGSGCERIPVVATVLCDPGIQGLTIDHGGDGGGAHGKLERTVGTRAAADLLLIQFHGGSL